VTAGSSYSGKAACRCGRNRVRMTAPPLGRFFCHCTICQRVSGRPFSDVTVHWSDNVVVESPDLIDFRAHRPPPNVSRGACKACGDLVVEHFTMPLIRMSVVPGPNFLDQADLPDAIGHAFYDTRVADIDDTLPKRSKYLSSQMLFVLSVTSAAWRRRGSAG
jgi:hypothetical protein